MQRYKVAVYYDPQRTELNQRWESKLRVTFSALQLQESHRVVIYRKKSRLFHKSDISFLLLTCDTKKSPKEVARLLAASRGSASQEMKKTQPWLLTSHRNSESLRNSVPKWLANLMTFQKVQKTDRPQVIQIDMCTHGLFFKTPLNFWMKNCAANDTQTQKIYFLSFHKSSYYWLFEW